MVPEPAPLRPRIFRRAGLSAERLRRSKSLRWLGPRLHEPQLWSFTRQRVARGVAIGSFFAVMLPIGQIPAAVVAAVLLRANPLAGAAATFISNPLTFAPIYYAAYLIGAALLGTPQSLALEVQHGSWTGSLVFWSSTMVAFGRPLMLGMLLMAIAAAAAGYFITQLVWRAREF